MPPTQNEEMTKTVAIANQKGGVGKTTTAINLSAALGILGKHILLVDADPQANATSGLGLALDQVEIDIYDCMVHGADVNAAIVPSETPGVDVLPSSINLVGAEVELVNTIRREYKLRQVLAKVDKAYDYILIDCLPSLGLITINALTAADSVLVPVQCEFFSLEGYGKLKNTVELVQEALNPKLTVEGVVMTMYDRRLRMANMVVEQVKEIVSDRIFDTIVHRNSKVGEAPSLGESVITYDASSKGAINFLNLAHEFLQINDDEIEPIVAKSRN